MRRMFVSLLCIAVSMATLTAANASAKAKTSLTIKANLADGMGTYTWSLSCDPIKGNHPNANAACALLKKANKSLFAPVPKNTPCTMIYGGDQRVMINGLVAGKKVSTVFTRANGCEIARYDRAVALFTIPATQVFRGLVTLDQTIVAGPVIFVSGSRQASTSATDQGFIIRLSPGVWLGSAGVGVFCTPVTISVPNVPSTEERLLISCTSQKS